MNPKIKKISKEYTRNAAKINELQARQAELEKQRTELENLDIIGIVRDTGLNPDQLAALIRAAHAGQAFKLENTPAREEGTVHEET